MAVLLAVQTHRSRNLRRSTVVLAKEKLTRMSCGKAETAPGGFFKTLRATNQVEGRLGAPKNTNLGLASSQELTGFCPSTGW